MNELLEKGWVHPHPNETPKEQFARAKQGILSKRHYVKAVRRPSISVLLDDEGFRPGLRRRHIVIAKGKGDRLTNQERFVKNREQRRYGAKR